MTWLRLPVGRSLLFILFLLFALVALLPLRLALGWLDGGALSAREARGSIWMGRLAEARFGPAALGDLDVGLRLLPLAIGRARIDIARHGGPPLTGSATWTRRGAGVDDLAGSIDVAALAAGIPLAPLELDDVSVRFEDGRCAAAAGTVRIRPAGELGGLLLPGGLLGAIRCDRGALLAAASSQSGMETVSLRIDGAGVYRVDLSVRPGDDFARDRLRAAGFRADGAGYTLSTAGLF